MDETLREGMEHLKRFEHTIHVTLKYTRTIDVIKNAIKSLILTFDTIIEALLEDAEKKKLIENIPKSPSLKSTKLLEIYPEDQNLLKYITFYCYLRDTLNAKHSKREEYRRHVTLVAEFENRTAEIDIDNLSTCEKIAFQFFEYAQNFIEGNLEREND